MSMINKGFLSIGLLLWVLGGLSACTSAKVMPGKQAREPQLIQSPVFQASDGTDLYARAWLPKKQPKAVILLLHGFNEYSGAFDEVGQSLAQKGIAVWAYDQRGFGRSAYRGLWSSAEQMAQDAAEMARLLIQQYPQQSIYLLGTSMGGAVALLAANKLAEVEAISNSFPSNTTQASVAGVILSAPAVWTSATQPFYQRWALEIAVKFVPGWAPTGESLGIRPTDNVALQRKIWSDPWMIREGSRMDTVAGLVDLMNKAFAAADQLKVPVLLLYGDKDELIPPEPIDRLWERLPKTQSATQQKRYPQGWHMLMRDLQGETVLQDIAAWVLSIRG